MEPGKLATPGYPLPVRPPQRAGAGRPPAAFTRRASRLLAACLAACLALAAAACGEAGSRTADRAANGDTAAVHGAARPERAVAGGAGRAEPVLEVLRDGGLRPVAFQDDSTLWGILRGRLARLDLATGRAVARPHNAWSLAAGPGVVSWRNETGTWGEREGDSPRRLAPTELMPGYDGPPDALWSPDGSRAILTWSGEWDGHHELLGEDGDRATLATFEEGYMLDFPALWLDDERVLFTMVASAPRGGEPEYREAGWRGDLAVLDLASAEFRRVTETADGTWLRPAGLLRGRVLVREDDTRGPGRFWLYRPDDWSREPIDLPPGRARAAGDAVVVLEAVPGQADAWAARLPCRTAASPSSAAPPTPTSTPP